MTTTADEPANELLLGSTLGELARVPPWVEGLGRRFHLSADMQFAVNLCLEELLSNVVLHAHNSEPGHWLLVRFRALSEGACEVDVRDWASHFNPLIKDELPQVHEQEPGVLGGQGLRLIRAFAQELEYDALPDGNRIRVRLRSPAQKAE